MSKYFKTIKDFDKWMSDFRKSQREKQSGDLFEQLMAPELTSDDYINGLVAAGYTDLDNLVSDGHSYQIGIHTNNGWLYRDEIDEYFAQIPEERIRDRKREKEL